MAAYCADLDRLGYAVVDEVIDASLLDDVLDSMARQVTAWSVERARKGDLNRTFEAWSLDARVIEFTRRGLRGFSQALDISLPQGGVEETTPVHLAGEVFALVSCPRLLDFLEPLLGPEIWLSPVGHTRIKVPSAMAPPNDGLLGDVPWHQDNGVLLAEADQVDIVTVWAPLVEVDEDSGCLQVVPTPRGEQILSHCPGPNGLRVPSHLMPATKPVPVPMERGSVLLMHSRTLHSSMPNNVPGHLRVSLDLRYQSVGAPTGRPAFPSFCLRSPERRTASFEDWRDGWTAARDRLAGRQLGRFNRWDSSAPVCA